MTSLEGERDFPVSDEVRRSIRGSSRSQADLSRATGLSESSLSRFVAGRRGLSLRSIDRLCQILGLQIVPKENQHGE